MPAGCPPTDRLELMLQDRLDRPEAESVESHVGACPRCQQELERLTRPEPVPNPTLWSDPGPAIADSPLTIDTGAGVSGKPPEAAGWPRIPGYQIECELGRGGMGVVYLAWQVHANRRVALKMLPHGRGRPEEIVRFRLEGENLARLQHPNVVQVYEVGISAGRPFFSMEYIAGGTLAEAFAAGPKPPGEAAGLVETLARAVHAAHQCGVVHRDLKPANILLGPRPTSESGAGSSASSAVTGQPVPKVTDFGLAKQVGSDAGLTQTGQILGTPSYMAPEQATGGAAVGVPADVYALGAILYEALAGRPPFQGTTPWETMMQVVHEPVTPPSRSRSGLPRDLEVVCLKALAKGPAARYPSADALAEDLRRFRAGEPILARPTPVARRAWLWCRRHPATAALLALLASTAAAGMAGIAVQWRRAEANLADSGRRLDLALRAIETYYTGASRDVLLRQPELKDLRSALLRTPLEFYATLRAELESGGRGDAATLEQLAEVLSNLGQLNHEVGREDDALEAYHQAAALARRLVRDDPHAPGPRRTLGWALVHAGEIDATSSRYDEARTGLTQALAAFEQLAEETPADPAPRDGQAACLITLGDVDCDQNRFEQSEAQYLRAIAIRRRLVAENPQKPDYLHRLGGLENNLAILYGRWGRLDQTEAWFRQGLDDRERLVAEHPEVPDYVRSLGSSLNNFGGFCQNTNRLAEAPAFYERALVIQNALVREHPTVGLYHDDLAITHTNRSMYYAAAGQPERAAEASRAAIAVLAQLVADHPAVLAYHVRLMQAQSRLGDAHLDERAFDRAEAAFSGAVAAGEALNRDLAADPEARLHLAAARRGLADVLHMSRQAEQADGSYRAALTELDALAADPGAPAEVHYERSQAHAHRGVLDLKRGQLDRAEGDLHAALAEATRLTRDQPDVSRFRVVAAGCRVALGDLAAERDWAGRDRSSAALDAYTEAEEEARAVLKDDPDDAGAKAVLADAQAGRARALTASGRTEAALAAWDQAVAAAPERFRRGLTLGRAATLATAGRSAEALEIAARTASIGPLAGDDAVALARVYARAARSSGGKPDTTGRRGNIGGPDALAAEAVAWLTRAANGPGRGDGRFLAHALLDPDFACLRPRPDFQALPLDLAFPTDPFQSPIAPNPNSKHANEEVGGFPTISDFPTSPGAARTGQNEGMPEA